MTTPLVARVRGRSRRILAGSVAGALGLGLSGGLLASPAVAADGPAPAPTNRAVIADVHADAISTFWEDGELVLDTRADTPILGTRYDADEVWFHVDDDSRVASWPAGAPAFVAPAGSTVWLAPQTQAPGQIWPGFSTEAVPPGTLDGDDTTLTLVGLDGPGDVELWQTGSFGASTRLWSSDEDVKSFTRKRVHLHSNWAFTQPGTYELTVRADASVGGAPVSDTQVYTFVVGELPEQVLTTTTLAASATELTAGAPVTLSAEVNPADVEELDGAVEFRDGGTVLGHEPIDDAGSAELTVTDLGVGTHSITAVFVPATTNLASGSTSDAVTVTVADGSGVPFGISGVAESYDPGDSLDARVVGRSLDEGETYSWFIRPVGVMTSGSSAGTGTGTEAPHGRIQMVLDSGHDGYELRARVRQGNAYVAGADTAWVPLRVTDAVEPFVTEFPAGDHHVGDDVVLPLGGPALADGDTVRLVSRLSGTWREVQWWDHVGDTLVARLRSATPEGTEFAVQTIRNGVAVATSEAVIGQVDRREMLVEGVRDVYRVGQTLTATATVHPQKDGLTHRWLLWDGEGDVVTVKEGTTADALSLDLPMTADLDGHRLYFESYAWAGTDRETATGWWSTELTASDADPDTQLLFFESLGAHYHQGYDINLDLVADPELAEGDTIAWEWLWPGGQWAPFPGASGMSHHMIAEQALDGVQVRARLDYGHSEETLTTEPVTIHHDDHGSPARQQPTVDGATTVVAGDTVTLRRQLPQGGATVLPDHRWETKVGTGEWSVLEGETGAELSFEATVSHDGAQYRVSILKPTAEVAYGPSPAVALAVDEDDTPDSTPDPTPTPTLTPTPMPAPTPAPTVPGPVVKAEPTLTVKAPSTVRRGAKARIKVVVRASGVAPSGKVRIKVAGKKRTVRLDDGRATVKVRIPRSTRPGRKKVVISYLGDDAVARDKQRTTVRITR